MAEKKKAAAPKARPRTQKELQELARKAVHAAAELKLTEPQVLDKLAAADKQTPGLAALELLGQVVGDEKARQVFSLVNGAPKPKQGTLPRPKPSGPALTTELCNLEVQLRKRKAELEKAEAGLELARGAVKTAENEVGRVQDAIAEALYDLRSGQGRIEFPEPKTDTAVAKKVG